LSELVHFFDRTEQDPVMTLAAFIGKVFSFTPEAPLVRFIRTCLLSGFDPDDLTEEQIATFTGIIGSTKYDEDRMLQAATMSSKLASPWKTTLELYDDRSFKVKEEEYVEPLRAALDKIERILSTPKQVTDILVGEREDFYKQMASYFPVLDTEVEGELDRLKQTAQRIAETEEHVKLLLKKFMRVAGMKGTDEKDT